MIEFRFNKVREENIVEEDNEMFGRQINDTDRKTYLDSNLSLVKGVLYIELDDEGNVVHFAKVESCRVIERYFEYNDKNQIISEHRVGGGSCTYKQLGPGNIKRDTADGKTETCSDLDWTGYEHVDRGEDGLYRVDGVKVESTGNRDLELTRHHKMYGPACAAVDYDYLLAEYKFGEISAIIEHKRMMASKQDLTKYNWKCLIAMANKLGVPLLYAQYDEDWNWKVTAVNDIAKEFFKKCNAKTDTVEISDVRYCKMLHVLRGQQMPDEVKEAIENCTTKAYVDFTKEGN